MFYASRPWNADPSLEPRSVLGPAVTVVVPVWDRYVHVVCDAVESVLAQSVQVDVLVVDNASGEPLPRFPSTVRVIRLPNRVSVGAARNAGLSTVRTEFVLFLDADDLMMSGTLQLLLTRLTARPHAVASCCGVVVCNAIMEHVRRLDYPSRTTQKIAKWRTAYCLYALTGNRMPTTGCVLMRTEAVTNAGGFADGDFAEDWALNVALAFRGLIDFVGHPGRLSRAHPQSLRAQPRRRAEVGRALQLMRSRLRADRAMPLFIRLALPLVSASHARTVRRLTPGGMTTPGRIFAAIGDGAVLGLADASPALSQMEAAET